MENGDTIAKVTMALSLIADIALLAFLISSCLIRRPRHDPKAIPFKSLFVSLLSYIVYVSSLLVTFIMPLKHFIDW